MVKRLTEATAGTPPKMAVRSNVYGVYVDEPLMTASNGVHYYLHSNRLYSVAAATDASGTIAERYKYDAYGRRSVTSGSGVSLAATAIGNEWGFTGRRHDEETGLVYMRARYMSPTLGRFVGRDSGTKKVSRTNIFMPDTGDGYWNGENLYAAYFIPNDLDPSGLLKCCEKFEWSNADNGGFDNPFKCAKDWADNHPWQAAGLGVAVAGATGLTGGLAAEGLGGAAALGAGGARAVQGAVGAGVGGGMTIALASLVCQKYCAHEVHPATCSCTFRGRNGKTYTTTHPCCPDGSTDF